MFSVKLDALQNLDGRKIQIKDSIVYLGALVSIDGNVESEISRRIGMAQQDFRNLSRIWNKISISKRRKLELLSACVFSTLTYGLQTIWLHKHHRKKLNGFQCRCLRSVLRIRASFVSRVSNKEVLRRSGYVALSNLILEQQLRLFGKYARDNDSSGRRFLFSDNGIELRPFIDKRVRGRPRLTWARKIYNYTLMMKTTTMPGVSIKDFIIQRDK